MGKKQDLFAQRRLLIFSTVQNYILRKAFLMTFSALASLVLLMVISQLFGDLTTFAEYRVSAGTVMKYLAYSIPGMVDLMLPFSVCLGILAAQAAFARNSEIIAMQSCSVSLARIYVPFIIVGLIATLLMAATSFYLYPVGQREAEKVKNLTIKKGDVTGSFTVSGGKFKVGQDIYSVDSLDVNRGTMEKVTGYRFRAGRLWQVVKADKALWNGDEWIATNLRVIAVDERGISQGPAGNRLPLLKEPDELVMAQTNTEILPLPELRQYILQLRSGGTPSSQVETLYHGKISFVFSPLIIALLVIPFGITFPRAGGIAKGITLGLVLGLSYWGIHSGVTGLGSSGVLHPVLAAWGTNLAALIAAVTILVRKRRAVYG